MISSLMSVLPFTAPPAHAVLVYGDAGSIALVLGLGLAFGALVIALNGQPAEKPNTRLATTRPALQH
jgi:hypothetical protein